MFFRDRIRVILRSLRYREGWSFGPRQSLGFLKYVWHMRPMWRGTTAELNAYSPPIGGAGYGRYLRGLQRMSRRDWVPLVAHVSVSDRCPYVCRRCSNISRGPDDPPRGTLVRLFDQLRAAGTARVALTGGEPLVREDLEDLVAACGPELSPLLFTSGWGLGADRARRLRQAGLTAAFISLEHFWADEHDRVRGRGGAWEQAVAAIRACLQAGIYTAAQAVVEPALLNDGTMDAYLQFCRRLGVDEVMLLEPIPVGHGRDDRESASSAPMPPWPSADDHHPGISETDRQQLRNLHLRATRDATLPKVSSMSLLESPDCLGCQAGFSFLYITAQGEVFPCDFVPLSVGNVFQLGVPEVCRRLVELLTAPSQACLALRLRERCQEQTTWPLTWEQGRVILRDYDPGPLPGLLRSLCRDR